jgi:hypothetical protein
MSDYLPAGLSGFPIGRNQGIQVVIGTAWLGTVPFIEDQVITLRHIASSGGSEAWYSETGLFSLNTTTNRLRIRVQRRDPYYNDLVVQAFTIGTGTTAGGEWLQYDYGSPGTYVFKELWNANPSAYSASLVFTTGYPNVHNQTFKSMEIVAL